MSEPGSSETDANSKPPRLEPPVSLHSAFEKTLEKFTSNIKFSSFKKKYRAIHEADPDGFKMYFDQLKTQFYQNVREDLKNCFTSYGIVNHLQSLEKINENKNAISWRPSGNPEEDVRDHLYVYKVQHRDKLKNYLSSLQVDNEEITTDAAVNHSEILHLKEKNKELYEQFSSITDLYTGSNFKNFEAKAVEMKSDLNKAKRKYTESPESVKKPRVLC